METPLSDQSQRWTLCYPGSLYQFHYEIGYSDATYTTTALHNMLTPLLDQPQRCTLCYIASLYPHKFHY